MCNGIHHKTTNIYDVIVDVRNNQKQVRDANPEYDSVDTSQGTKERDKNSPKNQVEKTVKQF